MNINIIKIIERYKVEFDHGPDDMYIEVQETTNGFFAECNYSLWTKKQDVPYYHKHPDTDINRAVKFVLSTITPNENLNLEDFCWVSNSYKNIAVLGTGDIINTKEFK